MPHGMAKQLNKKETETMNLNNSMVRKTVTSLVSFENKQEKSRDISQHLAYSRLLKNIGIQFTIQGKPMKEPTRAFKDGAA